MLGFLNLNKPSGWTSHDCVAKVRRLLGLKKVGHGGTLDPLATGVLPIAVGKATRLLNFLPPDKAYRARIRFGVRTTTDDLEGEVISQNPPIGLTLSDIRAKLPDFKGEIPQIPPAYSAISVGGKRLYELARKGEQVEVPTRTVFIEDIEILGWYPGIYPELEVAIACGGGTYIRAIARDLGASMNIEATLASLTRTRSCGFSLEDSLTLEDLESQLQQGTFNLIPPLVALQHLEKITLTPELTQNWYQGQKIRLNLTVGEEKSDLVVTNSVGEFLGIGSLIEEVLKPKIVYLNA
ncbi:MAG: tRNA pseudouridine(55) synthase TruB [Gloeocapsa sp. DLM2.Bin57]|nr:MAG: tRNA pseudouridine(55) synthase TruB [Gloeocapsa sp. DLM2.Bin57]